MRPGYHANPTRAALEADEVRQAREADARSRGGGSVASARARAIVALAVALVVLLITTYAVVTNMGPVIGVVFVVVAVAASTWLYRQFRSYG